MSLRVWLPLNRDLRNQGLESISMTGGSSSSFSNSSSYFNGEFTDAIYNTTACTNIYYTDNFSWSIWVKNNYQIDTSRPWQYSTEYVFTVGRIDDSTWGYGLRCTGLGAYQLRFGSAYYNISTTENVWNHISFSKNGNTIKIYLNGALYSTNTFSGTLPTYETYANGLGVGCFYYSDGILYPFKGYIYDFRIYDHALSSEEVHEISKGLVLHYTLSDPYVESTVNYSRMISGTPTLRSDVTSSNWLIEKLDRDTVKLTALVNNPSVGSYNYITEPINPYYSVAANTTVTLSCEIVDYKGSLSRIFPSANGFGPINESCGNIVYKTITHTSSWSHAIVFAAASVANIQAGDYIIIRNTQIELKDHPTPYTPSSRSQSIIYDSSGFCYNGTITGNLQISSDSPRYNYSTLIKGTIASSNINIPDGPVTLSFWNKPTNYGDNVDTSKIQIDFAKCRFFTYINYPYFIHDTDYKFRYENYWSDGKWHLITCVYDGTTNKIYIDGSSATLQTSTTTQSYTSNLNMVFSNNSISDFRIYTTALSESDIKELYSLGALISA